MLAIEISINRIKYIDLISIVRIGGKITGNCKYIIDFPKGYKDKIFIHRYDDGYLPLLCKCLNYLKRQGYQPKR